MKGLNFTKIVLLSISQTACDNYNFLSAMNVLHYYCITCQVRANNNSRKLDYRVQIIFSL